MNNSTKFFLGANSDIGFISYFRQLQEQPTSMQLLVLKGGPGSGKSSLMKRVVKYAKEKAHKIELIPCASDPESLDAFIDYSADFAMMDGTSPHVLDPALPGALQHIMYTGDLWDINKLSDKLEKIKELDTLIANCHSGAGAYIKAAASLLKENLRISSKYMKRKAAEDFCERLFSQISRGSCLKEKVRLLSAVSVGEIKCFEESVPKIADKIFVIEDPWGGAANLIMKSIKGYAQAMGAEFISCPCSVMNEKTDHIIFPNEGIGVVTKNKMLPLETEGRVIGGWYNSIPREEMLEKRFYEAQELLKEACRCVKDAKQLHDDLEKIYAEAMDFSQMDNLFESILQKWYFI